MLAGWCWLLLPGYVARRIRRSSASWTNNLYRPQRTKDQTHSVAAEVQNEFSFYCPPSGHFNFTPHRGRDHCCTVRRPLTLFSSCWVAVSIMLLPLGGARWPKCTRVGAGWPRNNPVGRCSGSCSILARLAPKPTTTPLSNLRFPVGVVVECRVIKNVGAIQQLRNWL